jgi:hypothetical protein
MKTNVDSDRSRLLAFGSKGPSSELNIECTILIMVGMMLAVCTTRIFSLINRIPRRCCKPLLRCKRGRIKLGEGALENLGAGSVKEDKMGFAVGDTPARGTSMGQAGTSPESPREAFGVAGREWMIGFAGLKSLNEELSLKRCQPIPNSSASTAHRLHKYRGREACE